MNVKNRMTLEFLSNNENVGIARVAAAAFAAQGEFTLNTIEEIKVAVSEAVTNAIVHGYEGKSDGIVKVGMTLLERHLEFVVSDEGTGIENVALARQPSYSTDPERMGLGFVFMDSFMDKLDVQSAPGQGTVITMIKYLPSADPQ